MAKQSIFGRIAQLAKANINAMLDSAEDPQKMLDQMVRDYTDNIAEAETAVAQTIGNLRMIEDDYNEDVKAASDWGNKALAASRRPTSSAAAGDSANADKFDSLAKVAIQRQMQSEAEAKTAEPTISSQREIVEKLKTGLDAMKSKRQELVSKRDELIARAKSAQAQNQVQRQSRASTSWIPPARSAASRRRSVAKRHGSAVPRSSLPPPLTPSSTRSRTSASRRRSRPASPH